MKDQVLNRFAGLQRTFAGFTTGQKVVAVLGTLALLLGGVMVYRWVSTPTYAPLYSSLSAADASAVIDQLDAQSVSYKITNGGDTVMVPAADVYKTRIQLSGKGLPTGSDGGYSLLDKQSLSTSQFKEQTDYKRAMEGELTKTIEAMNGVQAAVVHLAIPAKQVFADKQDPPTASVLVKTSLGTTMTPDQVQSIVHLVAASIDGMDPAKVVVADSTGKLLSTTASGTSGAAGGNDDYVEDFQNDISTQVQSVLDRVLGAGNSSVKVLADLNFDKSVIESRKYAQVKPKGLALSSTKNSEDYTGPASSAAAGGIVGPDGALTSAGTTATTGSAASTYKKKSDTTDNALDTTTEHREIAPGAINALHIGVVLDSKAAAANNPKEIQKLISASLGIDPKRGDTVRVSSLPFDRSAEAAAAKELKAANAATAKTARMDLFRNASIGVMVLLGLLIAWLRGRRRNKKRAEATTYVVEQLRGDAARREEEQVNPASALLSLESAAASEQDQMREELSALVERQPEDVAALLRGWLVER
jgi:flagellar M-ring protein FliF